MKITCECYYNNYSFKVGNRYLSVQRNAADGETIYKGRIKLNRWICEKLEKIAYTYDSTSLNRTREIVSLFFEILDNN